jgi:hypothetical protein
MTSVRTQDRENVHFGMLHKPEVEELRILLDRVGEEKADGRKRRWELRFDRGPEDQQARGEPIVYWNHLTRLFTS